MSPLRAPTVGGLAGGVGTTTVARALHGRDLGRVSAGVRWPDVVVCRATLSGLPRAEWSTPAPAPILVVTAEPDGPVAERLAAVGAGWSGPVVLPRVAHWAAVEDPYAEAAGLLGLADPPGTLRGYAEGLAAVVALLTSDGRLTRSDDEPDGAGVLLPVRGIRIGPPEPRRRLSWRPPVPASQTVGALPYGTAW